MIEKEPITVILSQRGWIRAMKGHVALHEIDDLKWREGDGPHPPSTPDHRPAAGRGDNGRVYTLAATSCPAGAGSASRSA
jgi:topoisomerase-4 subunit A